MQHQGYGPTWRAYPSYVLGVLLGLGCLLTPRSGVTHPLGNFSINHYTSLRLAPQHIDVLYLIDMAEIPTFQEMQEAGIVPDTAPPEVEPYLRQRVERFKDGLFLDVQGERLALHGVSQELRFFPGAGGLPTLKLGVLYRAVLPTLAADEPTVLHYQDRNFPGRAGWQEIIAVAEEGVVITHRSVPSTDRSQELTNYPTDLLQSPPQALEAQVRFRRDTPVSPHVASSGDTPALAQTPSSTSHLDIPEAEVAQAASHPEASLALTANKQTTPRHAFMELITTPHVSLGVGCLALVIAAGLGALHALEPGHGKTVVAAYLIGARGTARHALYLGLIVTLTHTIGVYLLGLVTLYASQYVVPEQLYPWLSVLSGVLIASVGASLLYRRLTGADHGHDHEHEHAHTHDHDHEHDYALAHAHHEAGHAHHAPRHGSSHDHGHTHEHAPVHRGHRHHSHRPPEALSFRQLLTLGMTGGIVPCPAALVVLLSAVAMQRIGFGLLLILAFSAGLAAVLIAIGLLMVYARQSMARWQGHGMLTTRWLPLASAVVVTVFGVLMTVQALSSVGIL